MPGPRTRNRSDNSGFHGRAATRDGVRRNAFHGGIGACERERSVGPLGTLHPARGVRRRRTEVRVLRTSGMLEDESPLSKIHIHGPDGEAFVNLLIPRDAPKMSVNRACYSTWCDHDGKVVVEGLLFKVGDRDLMLTAGAIGRWSAEEPAWLPLRRSVGRRRRSSTDDRRRDCGRPIRSMETSLGRVTAKTSAAVARLPLWPLRVHRGRRSWTRPSS